VQPSLALYRRYRPESFAELIGQDHVTEPLRAALANNRVNHAYLFSGPRGCGKTTSARILARALNCEKAPIADPCGECQSCIDLGRGGSGSVDVIEIDAASHGGVDDARDLRERAFFAPVSSRYKVYIIDEAHMVSKQGFNALLKLVEEPPEHLKFIFATTEPDKVIPTIRSRTHHYPFRLIPPRTLSDYLAGVCEREGVQIDSAALPLVVRAGAGSARDSLSVLDQLLSGAGPDGVSYELAASLLGYTPTNLLDGVVDALAAVDGASAFEAVDQVIEAGQDPEGFLRDLLRRLRDLVIIASVPNASASGLIDVPADQVEKLVNQASRFGKSELVRAADILATGLTEMRGATPPRLLLELIIARVLLPGADAADQGHGARLDRIERRLSAAPAPAAPPVEAAQTRTPVDTSVGRTAPEPAPPVEAAQTRTPVDTSVGRAAPEPAAPAPPVEVPPAGQLGLADVRRLWPDLLDKVKNKRRFTWILLSQNAQVVGLEGNSLVLGFKNAGARESFTSGGSDEILRQAALDLLGVDWKIDTAVDAGVEPGATPPPRVTKPAVPDPEPARSEAVTRARENITNTRPAGASEEPTVEPDEVEDRDDPDSRDVSIGSEELLQDKLGAVIIEEISNEGDPR
jgi:DNA polymerase-3 subunit gamma/tau